MGVVDNALLREAITIDLGFPAKHRRCAGTCCDCHLVATREAWPGEMKLRLVRGVTTLFEIIINQKDLSVSSIIMPYIEGYSYLSYLTLTFSDVTLSP